MLDSCVTTSSNRIIAVSQIVHRTLAMSTKAILKSPSLPCSHVVTSYLGKSFLSRTLGMSQTKRCVHHSIIFYRYLRLYYRMRGRKTSVPMIRQIMAMRFMQSVSVGPKSVQDICLNELLDLVQEPLRTDSVRVQDSLRHCELNQRS